MRTCGTCPSALKTDTEGSLVVRPPSVESSYGPTVILAP
jgi:hypothetical protein